MFAFRPCTCTPLRPLLSRSIHAPASLPSSGSRVPKPRAPFDTPASILSASKRGLEQYSDKFEGSFSSLFSKTSHELRDTVGMNIKESKYLLRILEKYRQGFNPDVVAVKEKPKKTIRGWGPRVQNGKRIR
ncbi:mitochondrial 37S ribosomal protein mS41 FYV4 [Sporobolomyces salmoneus]|uniref:mitochondrial 37S ribosomal protein mS41 FYV4 n=1 Tax=Sporobolomyces salmoneus TaxID=183962 RepID=UPI003181B413